MEYWITLMLCIFLCWRSVCIAEPVTGKIIDLNETELFSESYDKFSEIVINYGNIPTLSRAMLMRMETIKTIYIKNGTIPTCHVAPQFEKMVISRCHTTSVLIRPDDEYEMKQFSVVRNPLKELPKNLYALRQLEKLHLHDNEIEHVNMNEMNRLQNLSFVSLYRNKIFEISCSMNDPIYLPKLEELYLNSNKLRDISFEYWNATAVRKISLRSNRLAVALSFPSAFPSLETVSLGNNPLNCWWKDDTLKQLNTRKVTIADEKTIRCDKAGLIIEEIRTDKLQASFATIEQLMDMKNESDQLRRILDENFESANKEKIKQLKDEIKILTNVTKHLEADAHKFNHLKQIFARQENDTGGRLQQLNPTTLESIEKALARYRYLEEQLLSYNTKIRQNADALFGAWFPTNAGYSIKTGWIVLFTFIIKEIFI